MLTVWDVPQGGFVEPNPSRTVCGGPVHGRSESKCCFAAG